MKSITLIVAFALICMINAQVPANYTVITVQQKVDHFNYFNEDRFSQRVIISKDYWGGENYPIFFYAGNEGDVFAFVNNTGFIWENGPLLGAMVIFAEHRYYGLSFPANVTNNVSNYGYLSVEQALADYAELIHHFHKIGLFSETAPLVTFGGSYGGMLAAWFRQKYPHLTIGSLAASAPVAQFLNHYNCGDFNHLVTQDYQGYSQNCADGIRNTWPAIRRLASTSKGRNQLASIFNLCTPLVNETDADNLVDYLVDGLTNIAMTDYPNPASFLRPMPAYPMREMCKKINSPNADDVQLLQEFFDGFSIYLNYTGDLPCVDLSSDPTDLGAEAWGFQYCTELFLPICAQGGSNDFFEPSPVNTTEFTAECEQQYSIKPDYNKVEMMFGIEQLQGTSHIIFSNGGRDPWSTGGILALPNQRPIKNYKYFTVDYQRYPDLMGNLNVAGNQLILLTIPHACHHEDLRSTGSQDPQVLLGARLYELKIIAVWIQQFYIHQNKLPDDWLIRFEQVMEM